MKIERILVDLDPRKENRNALERASWLAGKFGAGLDLLVCEYVQWLTGSAIFDTQTLDKARADYLEELRAWIETLAQPLRDDGLDVSSTVSWHSARYQGILEHAGETGADLVLRAVTEHSRIARMFLGATDWELIRHSPQPLWLVKRDGKLSESPKVLAAVDPTHPEDELMKIDRRILDSAVSLADRLSGSIAVFHAYEPPMPLSADAAASAAVAVPAPRIEEDVEQVRERHRRKLAELVADYDIAPDRIHLVCGEPAVEIGKIVEDSDTDVVVTGAMARGWLERLMLGSTAEALLDAVDTDLLVIKPG